MPHNANRVIVSTPESGRHSCRRLLHINTGCIPLMPPFAGSFFHNVRPIRQIWRKRVGVEPTILAAKDRINGFEGHEDHRAPGASVVGKSQRILGLMDRHNFGRRARLAPR